MPAVMELDASHETVAALQRLVPEAIVGGGSFASWLPHPRTLLPAERMTSFASAQESAVDKCVRGLLRRVGLREDTHVATAQAGNREWPPGLVGSLTDKGTVVLGVIVDIASVSMIGIDLERMDRSDLGAIEPLIAPEGLPSGMDPPLARLLVFSAKEAVFKAQYPTTHQPLDFSEVRFAWVESDGESFRAAVRRPSLGLEIRAVRVGVWVVTMAICVKPRP